nr:MAG TPA: hypothetical protein [Caudoviricetes sp.]
MTLNIIFKKENLHILEVFLLLPLLVICYN